MIWGTIQGYLRRRRNQLLSQKIRALHQDKPVSVIDFGGAQGFWNTVEAADLCNITIVNMESNWATQQFKDKKRFSLLVGDARSLPDIPDRSFDLVVSNSVIEHVGTWDDIEAACSEMKRIGKHGWVQTPSPLFPIEPHFRWPFIHWTSPAMQRWIMRNFWTKWTRDRSAQGVRYKLEGINLIAKPELICLFPKSEIKTEWLIFPKSYIAIW